KGRFVPSPVFHPMSTGIQLTLADPNGAALVQTTLTPADLLASRDGGTIKSASRRGKAAGPVKRLLFRTRNDVTKWKAQLVVSPAPGGLPSAVTLAFQAGD